MKDTIRAVEGNSGDPVCKLDNKLDENQQDTFKLFKIKQFSLFCGMKSLISRGRNKQPVKI